MKTVKFRIETIYGVKYIMEIDLGGNYTKEAILKHKDSFISDIKEDCQDAKTIDLLIPVKQKRFTKAQLDKVGDEQSDIWNATYLKHTCYENFVEFDAIEHGERFTFNMSYDEIAKAL